MKFKAVLLRVSVEGGELTSSVTGMVTGLVMPVAVNVTLAG